MEKNNFQRLEEEEISRLPELPLGIVKDNVHTQLDGFRAIGGMIDLYLSKLIDIFVAMTGGKSERSGRGNPPTDPDNSVPGGPGKG